MHKFIFTPETANQGSHDPDANLVDFEHIYHHPNLAP